MKGIMIYGLQNQEIPLATKVQWLYHLVQILGDIDDEQFQVFLQSQGSPLDILVFSMVPELKQLVNNYICSYAIELSDKGIALDLENICDRIETIKDLKKDMSFEQRLVLIEKIEAEYKSKQLLHDQKKVEELLKENDDEGLRQATQGEPDLFEFNLSSLQY